jgi:hypothetical protein
MKALQILQRENPADQAKMEQFVKASLVYQLGALFKNQQEIIKDQQLHFRIRAPKQPERKRIYGRPYVPSFAIG